MQCAWCVVCLCAYVCVHVCACVCMCVCMCEMVSSVFPFTAHSIVWDDGVLSSGELYPNLVCSRPRMMDPMNPHNNLYMSGLGPAARRGNYGAGDGKWEWMMSNIDTLDLTTPF